jgi:hypothetical protein
MTTPLVVQLLRAVIDPHARLAVRLLERPADETREDSGEGFETAAVIVLLAGVDKVMSVALGLLYLAGRVDWVWMKGRRRRDNPVPSGLVVCGQGFGAKLNRLRDLDCDLTELDWLADLRNRYVHQSSLFAGYRIHPDFDGNRLTVRAVGPQVEAHGAFAVGLRPSDVPRMTDALLEHVGQCVQHHGCEEVLQRVSDRVEHFPHDPEPWTRHITGLADAGEVAQAGEVLEKLNADAVGEGLSVLLRPSGSERTT